MKWLLHKLKNQLFPPYKDISDEFINRLYCANAGMLHRGNLYAFDYVMKHLPEHGSILEIGSYCGLSTNAIIYYQYKYQKNNPFFTCDSWEFFGEKDANPPSNRYLERVGEHPELRRDEYMDFVKQSFINNLNLFSKNRLPYSFHARSNTFFDWWNGNDMRTDLFNQEIKLGGKIAFCFMDGDHTEEGGKSDWRNVKKFLMRGGFILFDDSADGTKGSRNGLSRLLMEDNEFEFVFKNPNYLFRKI